MHGPEQAAEPSNVVLPYTPDGHCTLRPWAQYDPGSQAAIVVWYISPCSVRSGKVYQPNGATNGAGTPCKRDGEVRGDIGGDVSVEQSRVTTHDPRHELIG